MERKAPKVISEGSGVAQWTMLAFSGLLLLVAMPSFFNDSNLAFDLVWILALVAMNAPTWLWPVYTVYIDAEGFQIESPLRRNIFYSTEEFAGVSVTNAFTTYKTYLRFKDGRQYKVILKLGFGQEMKLLFLDGPPFPETKRAVNKAVRDAIKAQRAA